MKVYASVVVGQEINGKNVIVKIEKLTSDKSKIDQLLNSGKNNWIENYDVPEGAVPMYFSRNPQEIELEDVEHSQQTRPE
jgi:hypothetical protein